MKMEEEQRRKI